jgi:hypothetical protein
MAEQVGSKVPVGARFAAVAHRAPVRHDVTESVHLIACLLLLLFLAGVQVHAGLRDRHGAVKTSDELRSWWMVYLT